MYSVVPRLPYQGAMVKMHALVLLACSSEAVRLAPPRCGSRRVAHLHASMPDPSPTLPDLRQLVLHLHEAGVPTQQIQAAFEAAVSELPDPSPAPEQPPTPALERRKPQTVAEAKQAFRRAYTGGPLLSSTTLKFVNSVLQTTAVWKFQYSRVFAVGLMALCDTFLTLCITERDRADVQQAICFGLGLEVEEVKRDAVDLLSSAIGMTEAELLASEEFAAIAASERYKYTTTFGVGLIVLMQTVGVAPGKEAIERWCSALNLPYSRTLLSEYLQPLSIDGIGRFSFETPGKAQPSSLESIGVQGSF